MFRLKSSACIGAATRLAIATVSVTGLTATSALAVTVKFEAPSITNDTNETCSTTNPTYLAAAPRLAPASDTAKSVALLGGQPSALEQIRLAQEAPAEEGPSGLAALIAASPLIPGLGPATAPQDECDHALVQPTAAISSFVAAAGETDFLGSKRLKIGRTAFDRDWQRVSTERISAKRMADLVGSISGERLETLQQVNSWVNQRITYVEDATLFSRADFWAGAKKTLRLGQGDCEDIALTKMHLLAAAGVPREDMILTIARDLVRNADHAMLIVRYDGRHYLLDNASDEILEASSSHDYRPVLSFGAKQTWLHGY